MTQWYKRCGLLNTCVDASPRYGCEHIDNICITYIATTRENFMANGFEGHTVAQGFVLEVPGIFANAGLGKGDILTVINNYSMTDFGGLSHLGDWEWGGESMLKITYLRNGSEYEATLNL